MLPGPEENPGAGCVEKAEAAETVPEIGQDWQDDNELISSEGKDTADLPTFTPALTALHPFCQSGMRRSWLQSCLCPGRAACLCPARC